MATNAYLYRMPSGVPGDISRKQTTDVDSHPLDRVTANAFAGYGLPGKLVAGFFTPIVAGDTAASIFGFLVRPYPTTGRDGLGNLPNANIGVGSIMRRGYMTVLCNAGTPTYNSPVYMRVATPATGKPIGGLEAAADGANTVLIPRTYFTSPADAVGNVEIEYNIGQ